MPGFVRAGLAALLLAAASAGAGATSDVGPRYRSKTGTFTLALPAGSEPRAVPDIFLDLLGWQRPADHSVAGAVWRLNKSVFERFGGSPAAAAELLRSTHRCGPKVCGTTPVRTAALIHGGELAYYEVADPSVPAERGVLSGVMRMAGDKLYRVQAINYDSRGPERDELLSALATARLVAPGEDVNSVPDAPAKSGAPWGLSFSGMSDVSFEQDTRSRTTVSAPPKRPPSRAPETLPAIPPPPKRAPVPDGDADYEEFDESKLHDPIPDLIRLLGSRGARMRARAADVLGQRGEPAAEAVPALTKALDDADGRVRASAALALGNIGPKALSALPKIRALASDRNPDVRLSAETAVKLLER